MSSLDTRNFTRRPAPSFPFKRAVEAVLTGWDISLVFAGEVRAQRLNQALRKKSYIPNVLSYVVGPKSAEIVICLEVAKREASGYDLSYTDFVGFLFIHGLLHVKGLPHGKKMDSEEQKFLRMLTA